MKQFYNTELAFAAVKADGSVVAWGDEEDQAKAVAEPLAKLQEDGVVLAIARASCYATAALKADGSVNAWGNKHWGGDCSAVQAQLADVQHIYATTKAFSALKADGGIVAWGDDDDQAKAVLEPLTKLQEDEVVRAVVRATYATAALKADGSVATWGRKQGGGDSSQVQSQLVDVQSIYSTTSAFAALKADGSVVAWGHKEHGGDCSNVQAQLGVDVRSIYATYYTGPVKPMPADDTRPGGMSDLDWQVRNWYNFTWLSGDSLVEQAIHSVDKIAWCMKDEPPVKAVATGGRQIPNNSGNIFDHFAVYYEYANGLRAYLGSRQICLLYTSPSPRDGLLSRMPSSA